MREELITVPQCLTNIATHDRVADTAVPTKMQCDETVVGTLGRIGSRFKVNACVELIVILLPIMRARHDDSLSLGE